MNTEQLDDLDTRLARAADTHGIVVVRAIPVGEFGWDLSWPDPDNVDGFIATAVAARTSLLYLRTTTAEDLREPDHEIVQRHAGETAAVEAAWAYRGVLHRLAAVADWIPEFVEQVSDDPFERLQHARDEAVGLARPLLADIPDDGLPNVDFAFELVQQHHPDLEPRTQGRIARELERLDREELQRIREARMAGTARARLNSGATKVSTAEHLGISTKVLDRILQQNPPQRAYQE